MKDQKILLNNDDVKGEYVNIEDEQFYRISNYDKMDPFLMTIVSSSDHWMFISSNGGLTAGRKNPDNALFPYYNDDIIHSSNEITGSKAILQVSIDNKLQIWEPFSNFCNGIYKISRNLYKNILGNKIIFEEINHDLGLNFCYSWMNSEKYGFVKKSSVKNINNKSIEINLIDGIQNILPYGLYQKFQNEFSTLADGYKKNELIPENGIGIFSLSSIPSDRAEPSESLKATVVWSLAPKVKKYLLSSRQLNKFRSGLEINNETDIRAAKGSYFINNSFKLNPEENEEWLIIADINQDSADLAKTIYYLENNNNLKSEIISDIDKCGEKLIKIIANADGLQISEDKLCTSRHISNVLFNVMRGGIFDNSYKIDIKDFSTFLHTANKTIHKRFTNNSKDFENEINYYDLRNLIIEMDDLEIYRLFMEYLPLTFGRRHGDPSRPWNRFSIDIKNNKNEKVLNYQGNWRDVFQNWEALALSFPEYLESMITRFLNASTADGYNPYRITRNGFDWETPEPESPWANIGYWGDHQIIYLLKLLELQFKHNKAVLKSNVTKPIYTYANIPYRIKNYNDILINPHDTIEFDHDLNEEILKKEKELGTDAKYVFNNDQSLLQVNLSEKLLVTLLSKLSNFIPGGGIWMNTQRPEWNDANNALVGNGVSMVTLYYLKRYVNFLISFFEDVKVNSIEISEEVVNFLKNISEVMSQHQDLLNDEISDKNRKVILDGLSVAGEDFRTKIYNNGFSEKLEILELKNLIEFLSLSNKYIDHTIKSNKRDDALFHSYNLMSLEGRDEIKITNLYEMLEGQVAVLSSGYLEPKDSVLLLKSLRTSKLYREDQNSYILYPDRQLLLFVQKNIIPKELIISSQLLKSLVELGHDEIVNVDVSGNYHFNGEIRNSKILKERLELLQNTELNSLVNEEKDEIIKIYESIFNHKAFTGRSGTFYKYEGLGSIYWHMVSKLALAVQETYYDAINKNTDLEDLEFLNKFYYEIKEGIGIYKSPKEYGAFPTDPYSHTPCFSGVQQPGMTGQVKEDIISRFGELGLFVNDEKIFIKNSLIKKNEFLKKDSSFEYYDVNDEKKKLTIEKGSLAFTYCQVPIIYNISQNNCMEIYFTVGQKHFLKSLILDETLSSSIFRREGKIDKIIVSVKI
ncbi:MAG: hypothetical protein H6612_11510 [Ignavibacteriales bacterium]|nr:hypothetical protein [Ignavibacteriales bacterium]MCB9259966.1 hypothetical protein [Ignavibacteriales bacterium]